MKPQESHRLAAIVFTDIVGYTKTMDKSEELAISFLNRQKEIFYPIIESYGGKIIKEMGDGLLIMFDSAIQAVRCTDDFLRKLSDEKFAVRAGIHIGDVMFREGDVFGSAVNIAARIEPLAKSNRICISEDVRSQIRNRKDISLRSIGKKELKGVTGSFAIYEVGTSDEQKAPQGFWKNLFYRRVIQVSIIYAIIIVIITFILKWVVKDFMLSPHLVQFALIALISLIPSVMVVTFFHGRPGIARWNRVERIVLPVNILGTILALFLVFQNKDLGATTREITYTNEEGETIARKVVKSDFRKNLAIFFFDEESKDASLSWLQYAIPEMIEYKFQQDNYISGTSAYQFLSRMKELGIPDAVNASLSLKDMLASEFHIDYFLTGTIQKEGDEYIITSELYKTGSVKLLNSKTYRGSDIFTITDQLTKDLKQDLDIPEGQKESKDLPLKEILTNSEEALKYHILGKNSQAFNNDWDDMLYMENQAVKIDPNFALAYANMIIGNVAVNNIDGMKQAFDMVMNLRYKLPEKLQFNIRTIYYRLYQVDLNKAQAVVEMWIELYPEDLDGHIHLLQFLILNQHTDEMIKELKTIIRLDPNLYQFVLQLADIYTSLGEYDQALEYYQKYQNKFPDRISTNESLGNFYAQIGDFDKATESFNRILLMEPNNVNALLDLSDIQLITGNFDKATKYLDEAMMSSKTALDSVSVYDRMSDYYGMRGQTSKLLEYMDKKYETMLEYEIQINVFIIRSSEIHNYVHSGKIDEAIEILEDLNAGIFAPYNRITDLGYLRVYTTQEDTFNINRMIPIAEDAINTLNFEIFRPLIYLAKGKVAEMEGDYDKAVKFYEELIITNPTRNDVKVKMGGCYRHLKKFDKAIQFVNKRLKTSPYNPRANYEMGMIYIDSGDQDKAFEYIKKAHEALIDADPEYKLANEVDEEYQKLIANKKAA